MPDRTRSNYRYAPLLVACSLLGGCKTMDAINSAFSTPAPSSTQPSALQTTPPPAGPPPTNTPTANRHTPGSLHFILEDTGWGDYYGWRIQILKARTNQGFKPILSSPMQAGEHLQVELWPDHYHVRVTLENKPLYDGLVEIKAGQPTVVQVRISILRNAVEILDEKQAEQQIEESGPLTRLLNIRQTFDPLPFTFIPGIEGRYDGPRENNAPAGKGRLTLHKGEERIAVVEEAVVQEDGQLKGKPVFDDERRIEGYDIGSGEVPPSAITHYKDGREFQGRYENLTPKEGVMNYPDGQHWSGRFANDTPQGTGVLGMTDGTVIEGVASMDASTFDGSYDCVSPKGHKATCYYFEGERIASEAEYKKQIGWRNDSLADAVKQAEELAAAQRNAEQQPAVPTAPAAAPSAPPAAAPAHAPADGCSALSGQFATSTNLSRIRFDGNGRGDFWQATYGGSTKYFFEVSFAYDGSPGDLRFTYDEAVYKDAGGRVIRRQSMPGGSSACSFNGRILNIGGTEYIKQ